MALVAGAVLCGLQTAVAQQPARPLVIKYAARSARSTRAARPDRSSGNSPPFAFLDKNRKPIGYSLDLCEIVVEEIVAELGKDVRVAFRP
jgi:ABC-type amino acid transport substrate-binding protein